jgi:S-formylglutathione hydrolase FrmB
MVDRGGTWSQIEVAGHRCEVFEPGSPHEHGYVVLYLHGVHLGRLSEQETYTRLLAQHGLRAIAPFTARSWWTDRVCAEFDPQLSAARYVTEQIMPYVGRRWQIEPPRVALFGTSMGGQGALRLAFQRPNLFPIVAALSPAIDYQLCYDDADPTYDTLRQMYDDAEAARQDTATLHVHPLNWPRNIFFACDPYDWPWIDSAQKLQMKLSALGIPHEAELNVAAGGHGFGYYNCMADRVMQFLLTRLEQERLRIA